MPRPHSRRQFLRQSAVLAAGACASVTLADEPVERRSGRMRVGIVGVDGGRQQVAEVVRSHGAEVVASAELGSLIEWAELDAVIVQPNARERETVVRRALERGLHVYSSPVGRSIAEARELGELAGRTGAVTQVDVRAASAERIEHIVRPVQAGTIGRVREVVCWTRSTSRQGFQSQGNLVLSVPMRALHLDHPTSIFAAGTTPPGAGVPSGMAVRYEFPVRREQPAVRVTWYVGDWAPPYESVDGVALSECGTLYLGETGHLLDDIGTGRALLLRDRQSPSELAALAVPEQQQLRNWLAGCRGESWDLTSFRAASVLNQNVLAGLVAYEVQQPLEWDGPGMRAYNCRQADALIRPALESIRSA